MARTRSLKPGFFLSERVASVPFEWRLLFAGLWTQADREGRLEDRPMRLKACLFPYDDLDIDQGLSSLVNVGLIQRYDRDGRRVIAIPSWSQHQQPHIREPHSELPAPGASTGPAPGSHRTSTGLASGQHRAGPSSTDPDPDPHPDPAPPP